ncbi:MAG: hypothetical protein FWE44_02035 [Defluviitaleaceae bacterium]|nr:hypothetical protein [Defluviitaleaceae bacterium]
MNTDRIKNIMLILLSALVVVLVLFVIADERQYILTENRISNAVRILEQNNIHVNERVQIPQSFRPMQHLSLYRYNHNILEIAARFFENEDFETEFEGNNIIFINRRSQNAMGYFVRDGVISFEMRDGFFVGIQEEDFAMTASAAEITSRAFIEEILGYPASNMTLVSNSLTPDGHYMLTFFDSYAGYLLYDSRIRIRVAERGVVSVFYSQATHNSFTGYTHPIFAADEALLALLNLFQFEGVHGSIELLDMQLVYIIDPRKNQLRAVPAYLFTLTALEDNLRFNVVLNAFTNTPIIYTENIS